MTAPKSVAIQGELGAFSHEAALKLLGPDVRVQPYSSFEEVFRALQEGHVEAALIPIENTLHGSVHENYDHLLEYDFRIVAEINLRIVHNLIAPPGVSFRDIRRVYSHPVALNQCLKFFRENPHLERVPYYDTAGSVKMLMEKRPPDAAAIASRVAASIYGARILKRSIEDDPHNYTRFFLLRRAGDSPEPLLLRRTRTQWKTSIAFTTPNVPGALFRALSAFALRDINLTKIESRPIRGRPWEYLFYLDFLGHPKEERVANALHHLKEMTEFLRILGTYAKSK